MNESVHSIATTLTAGGHVTYLGTFSPGIAMTAFEIHGGELQLHGEVDTDGLEFAIVCSHSGSPESVTIAEADRLAVDDWEGDEAQYADLIERLVVVASSPGRPLSGPGGSYPVSLLPDDSAYGAHLVSEPRDSWWPSGDPRRPFLRDGRDYIASLGRTDVLEFVFDVPMPDEYQDPWGPWWFGASRRERNEMRCTSSFLGGSMGADEVYGWVAWSEGTIWYVFDDRSSGVRGVAAFRLRASSRGLPRQIPSGGLSSRGLSSTHLATTFGRNFYGVQLGESVGSI